MQLNLERERRERANVLASFLALWDKDHPNADDYMRSNVQYAFTMGHLSAHQDIANRHGPLTN